MKYQPPLCSALPRSVLAVLALALPLALVVTAPGAAYAANACATKGGGVSGTGYTPGGGTGGTGRTVEGGTDSTPGGGAGGTGVIAGGGVGGTGKMAGGGVGGTGKFAGGGVGGTGRTATPSNVAIVGTITGFASICIDDLEVHYTPTLNVLNNGLPASVAELAVGQVVTIEAAADGLQADELAGARVSILNAVAGPVGTINPAASSLVVLGQTVRVTVQTLIADATGIKNFEFLKPGALVRVSGLRLANGDIVASRIETALSLAQASVLGPVTQSDADGFSIFGLRVSYADVTGASAVSGGEVMVSGRIDGTAMRAERITLAPSLDFTQQMDRLVLEGYIGGRSDSAISVGGVSVALSAATGVVGGNAADLQINQRVQIVGRLLADRSMIADAILLRRDPLAPPSAASVFPPSRAKALAFNKPGDARFVDTGDDRGAAKLIVAPGGTVSTSAPPPVGSGGGTAAGSSPAGGGSGAGISGGGIITPGGGKNGKPVAPTARPGLSPSPFKFDSLDFHMPGMPRRIAH